MNRYGKMALIVGLTSAVVWSGLAFAHIKPTDVCTTKVVQDNALVAEKPVIYIYDKTNESVGYTYQEDKAKTLTLMLSNGKIGSTYPKISDTKSWTVTPYADGTLVDKDSKKYDYIFWDGEMADVSNIDVTKGYSVRGDETAQFLEQKLAEYGLNEHEINDFITYWLPRMEKNKWNTFCFQTATYESWAKLHVEPAADSVIRVFVAWYPTEEKETIEAPEIPKTSRGDVTVVEWGGIEVRVEFTKKPTSTSSSKTTTETSSKTTETTQNATQDATVDKTQSSTEISQTQSDKENEPNTRPTGE